MPKATVVDTEHPWREINALARAKALFIDVMGEGRVAHRQAEIDALPTVVWKGKTLHTIRCHGDFGKGPHDMNVPESLLWNLIWLPSYRCVYHA